VIEVRALIGNVNRQFTRPRDGLVGGFNPSEKYEFVSWDHYSQYMEKYGKS